MEDGEFWLGLEKIHQITASENWSLDVELTGNNFYTGNEQKTITLTWTTFRISNEIDGYRLTIGGFQNNGNSNVDEMFNYHNGIGCFPRLTQIMTLIIGIVLMFLEEEEDGGSMRVI